MTSFIWKKFVSDYVSKPAFRSIMLKTPKNKILFVYDDRPDRPSSSSTIDNNVDYVIKVPLPLSMWEQIFNMTPFELLKNYFANRTMFDEEPTPESVDFFYNQVLTKKITRDPYTGDSYFHKYPYIIKCDQTSSVENIQNMSWIPVGTTLFMFLEEQIMCYTDAK